MWTVLYLFKCPDPATADALLVAAGNDNDSEVKVMAALNLGKLKDPRGIAPLLSVIENHSWADIRAAKMLSEIDRPALVEELHKVLKRGENHRKRELAADFMLYTAGRDFRERLRKVMEEDMDDDISEEYMMGLPMSTGSGWYALQNETQRDNIAKDISRFYTDNKKDFWKLDNRMSHFTGP